MAKASVRDAVVEAEKLRLAEAAKESKVSYGSLFGSAPAVKDYGFGR